MPSDGRCWGGEHSAAWSNGYGSHAQYIRRCASGAWFKLLCARHHMIDTQNSQREGWCVFWPGSGQNTWLVHSGLRVHFFFLPVPLKILFFFVMNAHVAKIT